MRVPGQGGPGLRGQRRGHSLSQGAAGLSLFLVNFVYPFLSTVCNRSLKSASELTLRARLQADEHCSALFDESEGWILLRTDSGKVFSLPPFPPSLSASHPLSLLPSFILPLVPYPAPYLGESGADVAGLGAQEGWFPGGYLKPMRRYIEVEDEQKKVLDRARETETRDKR